jgi:hypothetical protein
VPKSRKCGSIHPLPHTPSWRSASLVKHRDNFTFLPYYKITYIRIEHSCKNYILMYVVVFETFSFIESGNNTIFASSVEVR